MTKLSKSREKYLLEKYFNTKNKKNIPAYLSQFGCRDSDLTDQDLYFITQYVKEIDHLAIGGSFITKEGLKYLKFLENVYYLDLRSMPLDDDNLDCIIHLKNLQYLYIKFTNLSSLSISRILEELPNLETIVAQISKNEEYLVEKWEKQYPKVELVISLE